MFTKHMYQLYQLLRSSQINIHCSFWCVFFG